MIYNIKEVKHNIMFVRANTFGPNLVQYHLTLTLGFGTYREIPKCVKISKY